ncbi:MAG: acyl carrier protein [Actinomycetota bacterium]|nr:acyl carrier protein [Actinomycetota bacterium]
MSAVYDRLVALMVDVMNMRSEEIAPASTFDELDFDSLALVELTLAAQKEFGISIEDDELASDFTVAQAAELIEAKGVTV